MELISARVPPQAPINFCYQAFVQRNYRHLPGVTADTFAYVKSVPEYGGLSEKFGVGLLKASHSRHLPDGSLITVGRQRPDSRLTWKGIKLPNLALLGSDTMGIGSGGGFIVLRTHDFHPVISHMVYNNLSFSDDELFEQKCLRIDLDGGPYTAKAHLYKVYVVTTSLYEATSHFPRQ